MKDPYEILGIPRDSSESDIKKTYKKLALQWHPDKNKEEGSEEKFKEISQAYKEIIEKSSGTTENPFADFGDFSEILRKFGFMNSNNPLGSLFGNIHFPKQKLPDIRVNLHLDLFQICEGGQFDISYEYNKPTGVIKQVINVRQVGPMHIQEISMQPETVKEHTSAKINVYPGYDPESGPIILQHSTGDLYVTIIQKEHPNFSRVSNNLFLKLDITLKESLVGFEKVIQHVNGKEMKINCKNIVNPYEEKIIQGAGINEKGFLSIKFHINFPTELTESQKEELGKLM